MSIYCPLAKRRVVYLDCKECEEKLCKEIDNLKKEPLSDENSHQIEADCKGDGE